MEEENGQYRRRRSDEQFIDHEKRIIVVEVMVDRLDEHHKTDLETIRRISEQIGKIDERIVVIAKEKNEVFSDKQVEWLGKFVDERNELREGRRAIRVIVWAIGLVAAGAASALLAVFGIKR